VERHLAEDPEEALGVVDVAHRAHDAEDVVPDDQEAPADHPQVAVGERRGRQRHGHGRGAAADAEDGRPEGGDLIDLHLAGQAALGIAGDRHRAGVA